MFVAIVNYKTYIAVFLTFIFTAKFVTIDADGLNMLFNASPISFVNQHCKTQYDQTQSTQTVDFSQTDPSASETITLNSFCTPQFQFAPISWDIGFFEPIPVFNDHLTSRLSYLYLENSSPPPRLASLSLFEI